jgi:hypothetical protein
MASEAFVKYTAYLCLLIHEQRCGRDEGENTRADQIRDEMDPFWYQMTEEETALVGKISETVYVIDEEKLLP